MLTREWPGAWRSWLLLGLSTAVGVAGLVAGVLVGAVDLPAREVIGVVVQRTVPVGVLVEDRVVHQIVWDGRVPRVLLAALIGAALSVVGAVLQTTVRNPLADPYVLGVSGGATVGAVSVVVLAPPALVGLGTSGAAFAGAVLAFVAVVAVARGPSGTPPERLVLAGVVVGAVLSAVTSWLVLLTRSSQAAQGVLFWLLGSLGGARWDDLGLPALALVAGVAVLAARTRSLDALAAGDDVAASLGVPVERTRWIAVTVACLLTGTAVSVSGAVGFVGLVVPHLVRLVVGPGHARLLPGCVVAGAALVVVVDLLARTAVAPRELPLGVVTAIVGAPVFLLVQRRRMA